MMSPVTLTFERHFNVGKDGGMAAVADSINKLLDERIDFQVVNSRREILDDDGSKRMYSHVTIQTTSYGEKVLLAAELSDEELLDKMVDYILKNKYDLEYAIKDLIREKYDGASYGNIREEFMDIYLNLL